MTPSRRPTRDLVSQLLKLMREQSLVHRRWAKVSAVHTGPPVTVDVNIGASTVLTSGIRCASGYTSPTVNDRVALDVVDGDVVAVYKLQ